MKAIKKILALVLVAMMAMGMVSALADNGVTTNSGADLTKMKVPVTKTLYFVNQQGAEVYEPDYTYTYTVTSPAVGTATVKDSAGNQVSVKQGDLRAFGVGTGTDPVYTGSANLSLVYSPNHERVTVPAGANGIGVTKKNFFQFDGTKLKTAEDKVTPGVYRYLINETSTVDTKNAKGITEVGNPSKSLVLDIFVKSDGTVAGATIHDPGYNPTDSTNNDINNDQSNDDTENETGKTTGFGDGDDPTNPDTDPADDANDPDVTPDEDPNGQLTGTTVTPNTGISNADKYETYNFQVKKTMSGDMADASHNFPFTMKIANSVVGAPYTYFDADRSTASTLDYGTTAADYAAVKRTYAAADGSTGLGDYLKKDETILVKGIAFNASTTELTVQVAETNDTTDVYTTTATKDGTAVAFDSNASTADLSNESKTAKGAGKVASTAALSIKTATTNEYIFNNELNEVSPTGLVLRFAPYFAMFAAGVALFIILGIKRRKSEEE